MHAPTRSFHRTLAIALGAFVALGAPLLTGTARADQATQQAEAEGFYKEGDKAYNLGRYEDAAGWFIKAYEAWPLPEFLYNIAQSYRLGGNCKQALHFYKRFKSLKERDAESPLSAKKRTEIDGFISSLQECASRADTASNQQPDTIDRPGQGDTGGGTTSPGGGGNTQVAAADGGGATGDGGADDDDEDVLEVSDSTSAGPTLLSARAGFGAAMIQAGPLDVPVQPSLAVGVGYPLALGKLTLDVGATVAFSPVPYRTMAGVSEQASLLGVMANAGLSVPLAGKLGVRGDLGVGALSFAGLGEGNPFTVGGATTTGALGMLRVRVAVGADFALTDNLTASVTPISFSASPAKEGLDMNGLSQFDFLVGVGYRM
jgi:hypothetical protein